MVGKFAWEEEKAFVTWPTRSAEALFNSQSLRSAGRSPAVDFWQSRELRLCGNRNYREVYIRTGEPTGTGKDGISTFWVLQSRTHEKVAAAEAIVPKDVAEIVANLIASEGAQLATWLQKAGIVSEKELDLAQLHKYLQRHCAVIEGPTKTPVEKCEIILGRQSDVPANQFSFFHRSGMGLSQEPQGEVQSISEFCAGLRMSDFRTGLLFYLSQFSTRIFR